MVGGGSEVVGDGRRGEELGKTPIMIISFSIVNISPYPYICKRFKILIMYIL